MAGPDLKAKVEVKMKSEKSQITMLIIVGLVLFIVVSLVLYLSKSVAKNTAKNNIKGVQQTAIDVQPISDFVAKCLNKLAKDAIILLGKQGGVIYKSQGGTSVDYRDTGEGIQFVKYSGHNVAYNINPPAFANSYDDISYSSDIKNGNYPWIIFPYTSRSYANEKYDGFFGISYMPPINSSEGSHSFQDQIETYIDNNMAACANFDIFKNQGYEIKMDRVNATIVIGTNDVAVKSSIPIKITNMKTREFTDINEFTTNIDVRLKDIYFYTKDLINNDIKNINFELVNKDNNKNSISVKIVKTAYSAGKIKADIVVITDEKSSINGKPFEYTFARKNRAPALYYIKNKDIDFVVKDDNGYYDIAYSDLWARLSPKAIDPDEDDLTNQIRFYFQNAEIKNGDTLTLNDRQPVFKVEVTDGVLSDWQPITGNPVYP